MKTLLAFLCLCASAQAIDRDKAIHFGAGFAVGTTCNIGLYQLDKDLSSFQRAWFCALSSFAVGAGWEYLNRRESRPDPMDIVATGVGGLGAAIFTITIDF